MSEIFFHRECLRLIFILCGTSATENRRNLRHVADTWFLCCNSDNASVLCISKSQFTLQNAAATTHHTSPTPNIIKTVARHLYVMPFFSSPWAGQRRQRIMVPWLSIGSYEAPAVGRGRAAVGCHVCGKTEIGGG